MFISAHANRRPRGGFTLIELLVVVAILALLISILLPSLNGARRQARQVQCLTNMASIGKASMFYAQEFKGWVIACAAEEGNAPVRNNPRGYTADDSYARTHFAISLLNGLLFDHPVKGLYRSGNQKGMIKACGDVPQLQCPVFPNRKQNLDYVVNGFSQEYPKENCDHDNGEMRFRERNDIHGDQTIFASYFHKVDAFKVSTARRIYVIEGNKNLAVDNLLLHDTFFATHLPFAGNARMNNDKRHPKGTNALFFDGHAERMDYPTLDPGYPNSIGVRMRWFSDVTDSRHR
jgi:prepilin-type N-terminal cleavage/methylation domain-containing protein/prepilin-type processing-associated H-X9-DG protein